MLALVVMSLLATALAACGGSSASSTASSGATGTETTTGGSGSTSAESTENTEGSSTSPSSPSETRTSPPTPGFSKKAKLAAYGYEAPAAERDEASKILERNLKARAAGDYATQCKTLGKPLVEAVEKSRYHQNCVNTLKIGDLLTPPAKTADTMQGPIVALRVKGPVGYALYHGKDGQDYAMRMELENGKWKVGEVLTEKLP